MKIIRFNTIRKKLTFWLLLIALVPLFISLLSTYIQRVDEVNKETYNKLSIIRDLKVQQLTSWIKKRISEVHHISEGMELRGLEDVEFEFPMSQKDKQHVLAAHKLISRNLFNFKDFSEISYINAKTGIIELSTKPEFIGLNQKANLFYSEPLKNGELFIKDIHYSNTTNKHEMTLSMPVFCNKHNTHIIGIIIARINLSNSLYVLLNNRVGLGKTGETLIVNKNIFALNELRWYDNAPLNLKIDAAPALAAARGETGVIKALDYRGEPVLAAYTYIPETQWGFVCKQDMYELKAPIRKMLRNFILIFLIILFISFLLSFYIGKSIAKPIVAIHNVAQKIKMGEFSVRNTIDTDDELGLLAKEFNNMADFTESKIKIQQGVSEISDIIISQSSVLSFGKAILQQLMKISQANMAVFYVLDEEKGIYEHFTSIGANSALLKSFNSGSLEGEFGNVLVNKEIHYLKRIPENTRFTFNTTAGNIIPSEIITIPVLAENTVVAIISLVNINKFDSYFYDIIQQVWLSINTAYSSLLSNERTSILAEHLARMNYQLESQSEELRSSTEELYDQNIELEKQKKKVEDANQLKSEFLSNMSHELRTPLNSINALSQVLISQGHNKLNSDEFNYLKIIERNGKNLLSLINDILDLSRIEAGKMDIAPNSVSLNSLLSIVKDILITIAEEKGISIELNIQENLPRVESDEMRLHQVLLNIVSNAVKFTSKGTVTINAFQDNENVIVRVSDTGIGIAEEMLPHIFDEFRQADGSSSRKFEGTGLGLAIANKLIKILGGTIAVKSELEIGSVFTITIPIKWYDESTLRLAETTQIVSTKIKKNTILIIEDDVIIANEISSYLSEAGFEALVATNGAEALVLAEQYSFYAITLDIYMPETDGWEVMQKLKASDKTKDIPVIIVSVSKDRTTGFAMGAIGYVSKPINKVLLLDEINKLKKPVHNILIVDDNLIELNEMANMFTNENIQVFLAHGGVECLKQIEIKMPDILILDLLMPDFDGFHVLHKLRTNPKTKNLPVIIVTAKILTKADKQLLKGNVSSLIAKGENGLSDLYSEIERTLKQLEASQNENSSLNQKGKDYKPVILIIEDNSDNMTTFKAILNNQYTLIEALNGEEGLVLAKLHLPDLVLLDMSLPKLDGEQVVKLLKKDSKTEKIPVIAVSAKVMKGDKEKFIEAGCDDFVPKPIDAEELNDKILRLLK